MRNRNSVVFRDDEGCASSLQEKQLSAHMDGDNVKPNKTYASLKGGNRGVMQKKTNYQKMKVVAHVERYGLGQVYRHTDKVSQPLAKPMRKT